MLFKLRHRSFEHYQSGFRVGVLAGLAPASTPTPAPFHRFRSTTGGGQPRPYRQNRFR
ncbi:hypothetical protein [Hymenobacter telluris]|uniref:hypothetical protein n=1 Tax=Hymenobacter telluris TaxID=2816474 RepID=UPI001A8D5E33|nr:hypothetical protein [Hymenobacter telluris]